MVLDGLVDRLLLIRAVGTRRCQGTVDLLEQCGYARRVGGALAGQVTRDELAGEGADGDVELAPVSVFRRLAQVADMDLGGGAVNQDMDRPLASC